MSRTLQFSLFFGAICISAAAPALAALPDQPALDLIAGDADHGVYSVRDQSLASDPAAAIAYDNFSLVSPYELAGISWTGIFAEPLPLALSHVDFIVSIWGDDGGTPDTASPVMQWELDGGFAGLTGADVTAVANGKLSPSTSTTPGGGPGYDYSAEIMGTLAAGDYWISIQADQLFDNEKPIIDPEWQWHLGSGPNDGFVQEDLAIGPGLVAAADKDLAFALRGSVVPEPSGLLLILLAGLACSNFVRQQR